MSHIEWKLPVPSTAILGPGPTFAKRLGREIALEFTYEDDSGDVKEAVVFYGVEAFKCRYLTALGAEALDAYDVVLDRGDTAWLAEIRHDLTRNGEDASAVKHFMITFDGGPCYEFVCRAFRGERAPTS